MSINPFTVKKTPYARIWREAMHSIGKFEDYQLLTYWTKLVEENGFKIQVVKEILGILQSLNRYWIK